MEERREYQRLALTKPIDGWFGDDPIRLLNVSVIGARVDSHGDVPLGSRALLRFFWRDHEIEIVAETVRSTDEGAGLRFIDDSEELRQCIAESALEVLRAQEANLEGERERNIIDGEETLTAASAGLRGRGYVTYTLLAGVWTRQRSLLPDQPANGFTLSVNEPAEEVELLLRTYASGDDEARKLTRILAELSVATVR